MSDSLKQIMKLAGMLVKARANTKKAEAALAEAKEIQSKLELTELPEMMLELGMSSVKLSTGETVNIEDDLTCGISAENAPAALGWLDKNQFGGLIKTQLTAYFAREDRPKVDYLLRNFTAAAKESGVDPMCEVKEAVHNATLKSFVKEELAKGTPIPLDLFSVHQFKKASVVPAKKKK